jgi:beta-lactamase regulating signal transducer with metallopeptidase domain
MTDATILAGLIAASWQGGLLALALVAATRLLGPRLSPRARGWLWWLVALRLAWPITLALPILPATPDVPDAIADDLRVTAGGHRVTRDEQRVASKVLPENFRTSGETTGSTERPAGATRELASGAAITPGVPRVADDAVPAAPPVEGVTRTWHVLATPRLLDGFILVWLAGVIGLLLPGVVRALRTARHTPRWCNVTVEPTLSIYAAAADDFGLRHPPRLVWTAGQPGYWPGIFGRPAVLLPSNRDFSRRELRLILRHELAHHVRRDAWQRLAFWLLRAIHWPNPLAWFAAAASRADQEQACDAAALAAAHPADRRIYADLLLTLAAEKHPTPPAAAMAGRSTVRTLTQRLAMTQQPQRSRPRTAALVALPLFAATLAGMVTPTPRPAAGAAPMETPAPSAVAKPATAVEPKPIAAGELVQVGVPELMADGQMMVMTKRVAPDGTLDLPMVAPIPIAGLSDVEARKAIGRAYAEAQILRNPIILLARTEHGEAIGTLPAAGRIAVPKIAPDAVPQDDELLRLRAAIIARQELLPPLDAKLREARPLADEAGAAMKAHRAQMEQQVAEARQEAGEDNTARAAVTELSKQFEEEYRRLVSVWNKRSGHASSIRVARRAIEEEIEQLEFDYREREIMLQLKRQRDESATTEIDRRIKETTKALDAARAQLGADHRTTKALSDELERLRWDRISINN